MDPQQKSKMEKRCVDICMLKTKQSNGFLIKICEPFEPQHTFAPFTLFQLVQKITSMHWFVCMCVFVLFVSSFLLFPLWLCSSPLLSLYSFHSICRNWSQAEVGREQLIVSAVISPSPACPSAPALRAAQSTVLTKRLRTAAASWT